MAADDNTLVVSWKEAADIQLCTPNDALVIPSNVGDEVAGCASRIFHQFLIIPAQYRILFSYFTQAYDLAGTQFARITYFSYYFLIKDVIILF